MANDKLMVWKSLSRRVLASILVDSGAVIPVMDIVGKDTDNFPAPDDAVYAAILKCIAESVVPTPESVAERASTVDIKYVGALAASWTDEDNRNLFQNARQLKEYGLLEKVRLIGAGLTHLDNPAAVLNAIAETTVALGGLDTVQSDRKPDADAVSKSAWDFVENFDADTIIPTGMGWFDSKAAGLWHGMMYWVVGAYKSGKSTLMRNIALSALEHAAPVDVFVAEGSREMFALSMQAMIATKWLYDNQLAKRAILSPLFIMRAWARRHSVFSSDELHALKYARRIWDNYPARVWDTTDGIRDVKTLSWRIRQSRLRYGTRAVFIDYLQLLGSGDTEYQRVSSVSRDLQEIAQSENVAIVILAQRNENAINSTGSSHSPGVKGGGDPAATADFMFLPKVDSENPSLMDVRLHLSRWTATGAGAHVINQQSGLIIDKYQNI